MPESENHYRGPRRPAGAPVGPDAVRRAVLDAASELFATRGIGSVSDREIAVRANVHASLINRYIGSRQELVTAVIDDLGSQMAESIEPAPLGKVSFEPDSIPGMWVSILAQAAVTLNLTPDVSSWNPAAVLIDFIQTEFGLDQLSARIRATQILASAMGWRLIEPYLLAASELGEEGKELARAELTDLHRAIAAMPLKGTASQ